jgi:deazaflavin-dependent oxidoreductase (nitroreductase family)
MKHYKGFWGWLTATFVVPKPGSALWRVENAVNDLHVWIFQRSRGRVLGTFDGAPLLVLHTRGAKTGRPRQSPMIYLRDDERIVVVASIGGNPRNPGWYHNLRADPDAEVEIAGGRRQVRARQATAEEAAALWPRLHDMWPAWQTYKTRTDREFPVMILERR